MATRMLSLFRGWFPVLLLALAPMALVGCRNSSGGSSDSHSGIPPGTLPPTDRVPPAVLSTAGGVVAVPQKQAAYGGQKTCPVTGDALGSMGPPIPVSLAGGQTIYVCCRGCANRVQRDPATYVRKVEVERGSP